MQDTEPLVVELKPRPPMRSMLAGNEGILWVLASGLMLFIGILKGINLVIVMGYVLLGLWVINWILAHRRVKGISAKRLPRPPLQAGMPLEWTIEIHDPGPTGGIWSLEERVGDASASWLVVRGGGGKVVHPRVRATFPRRGRYTVQPLVGRSSFPFGLARKSVKLLPADDIVVFPKPAWIDQERFTTWLFHSPSAHAEERRKIRRVVDREAEVHGLRDYRAGDSPRRVHWKATARRNKLTVHEYEDAAPPRLLLVVDPSLPKKPTRTDCDALEAVISLAAGIVQEWRRGAGARLALVVAGAKPVAVDGSVGSGLMERQLTALALEEGGETGDVASCLTALPRAMLSSPALVITSRADSPVLADVQRILGRKMASVNVHRLEAWYRLPS